MTAWAAKRFWTDAIPEPCDGGFTVRLDTRLVRTPLKTPLVLPTKAMADAIAAEWQAQTGKIDPATMPCTRAANSAIDKVAPQFDEVVEMLAAYGGTDLLCYRATGPDALIARQATAWNPLLDWAATALGAPLNTTAGVMHIPQPDSSLAALQAQVARLTAFQLAAFHDLVAISGSLLLALAVIHGRLSADEAWTLSRIDEDWQAELWGEDEDATALAALKRAAFLQADRFFALCG
jgi:chaperone required for assembly of F1-ATPase